MLQEAADPNPDDPQVRDARPSEAIAAALRRPGMRLSQKVAMVMEGYADRPALGQRKRELVTDTKTGRKSLRLLREFTTITYRELWERVGVVSTEWQHHPGSPLRAGDFVCILGFTGADYATIDLACIHLGAVSVPLQSSAPVAQHRAIIAQTQPRMLAVGVGFLDDAVEAVLSGRAPERLVVFDYDARDDDHREAFEAARRRLADARSAVVVDTLSAVLDRGRALPRARLHVAEGDGDALLRVVYTSGSTGTPKGAMHTERIISGVWSGTHPPAHEGAPIIDVGYLPMSHAMGYFTLIATLANGGTNFFTAKSDLSTLFEDIALVRPTVLNLVPRVCEMLNHRYLAERDRRVADGADPSAVEAEVRADMRQTLLGGRVASAICASAPLSAELHAFTESLLGTHVTDGYGSTEAGFVLRDHRIERPPVIDYKLIDVPELGYFLSDRPYPRGELLLKTDFMTPGYYQRPDVTAAVFDADGFYTTGDIMAQIGPDEFVYVDRRNNVLKLAQGEFVTPSRLEAVFADSALIAQIFIHGSSEQSFLLAVVVPTPEVIAQLERYGVARVRSLIGESLQHIAHVHHLNGYEIPREFLIEIEPFTLENGLLTDAGKLARPKLKARYGERLEQMYADFAAARVDELRALRTGGEDRPLLDTVRLAVQAELGLSPGDVSLDARFADLGGDSLSALSFSELLREIFGIEVPVGVINNPAGDLRGIADYIESQRASGAKRPTFAAVHGSDSAEVHAGDLTLDKFIDAQTLKSAATLPRPSDETRTVLLTGATGYLGRFLALQWLERLSDTGGTLICIVRAGDAEQARRRIEQALDTDPELIGRFRALAADRLEVLAGDIGEPGLGLDETTWNRLAERVDLIVHPAAHVNHVLPYNQLFGPNVVGTAELIRLAITTKAKPINYVSTVAAAVFADEVIDEDADIRVACPARRLDASYANGYATSKWASEVLLREAHDLCDLPVTVFRCDMILAHTRYAGQLNVPDMFTRLLLSLITTGIAPRSFYQANGDSPRAHYDGLPVDVIAQAIAAVGTQAIAGFHSYNVVNPNDDGISLDSFVDWLIDAGYPIQRIDDYDEWISRFAIALRTQPEGRRQRSVLPLLEAYRHPAVAVRGSALPSERFQAAVHATGHDIPRLSESLIEKYAADLRKLRLL